MCLIPQQSCRLVTHTALVVALKLTFATFVAVLSHASEPLLVDVSAKFEFARELGGNADGLAGAAWFDFDCDGFLDLFIPNVA
jgi:hypothetical protein